jgi:glutamate-1-semialdehyde 2,1-aminomutase
MSLVAPLGPGYKYGTMSGNPLAVSAGLTTLALLTDESYAALEVTSARLATGLERALADSRIPGVVQRVGSMLTLFFSKEPVRNWNDAKQADTQRFAAFHRGLIARGVYWPPSQFEAAFVSLAHSTEDIEKTVSAARAALAEA